MLLKWKQMALLMISHQSIQKGQHVMDFITIAKTRCSIRSYTGQRVEPEKLEKILEAAHVAPTAANLQPVRLIVVQSVGGLAKIGKAANIYGAPLAIIVCADRSKAWVRPFDRKQTGDIDASILTDHMMLQAAELGLGSVWVCCFKPDVLRREFCLPANLEPVNILAAGYAGESFASTERHSQTRIPVNELVSYESL
jgi:nitroreductase